MQYNISYNYWCHWVFFNSTDILPDYKVLIENVTCKIFNLLHTNLQCFRVETVRNLKTK